MDRPIEQQEVRRRQLRRAVATAAGVLVLVLLSLGARALVRPSLSAGRIRIATVERGDVEATTLCSGTVIPATELVIPCPFDTRVERVLEQPGAELQAGQALIELDDTEVRLAVERLQDQIALSRNRRRELELGLERQLAELAGRQEIQRERLAFLAAKSEQQRALHELGLSNRFELRQAELDERIARIELRQLGETMAQEQESTRTRITGLEIELSLLGRDLDEQQERLHRAMVRADRTGVLTWITGEEGATIREGGEVARIADLRRFRVEATASDLHANRIAVGMPVQVVIGEQVLSGRISNIPPAIDQGLMTLKVELDEPDHPALRQNLRADVHVVTAFRPAALRIKKGPFINGSGEQEVFVLRGDEAIRTRARIGVAGIDHYEVLSGLAEGDRVIISSMSDYLHMKRVRVPAADAAAGTSGRG
jgi:HlyD family secretion protein